VLQGEESPRSHPEGLAGHIRSRGQKIMMAGEESLWQLLTTK
jgi:hypothetical protein